MNNATKWVVFFGHSVFEFSRKSDAVRTAWRINHSAEHAETIAKHGHARTVKA